MFVIYIYKKRYLRYLFLFIYSKIILGDIDMQEEFLLNNGKFHISGMKYVPDTNPKNK